VYDIIGDIHGHADELIKLLTALGYQKQNCPKSASPQQKDCYQHPTNKVIFLGDFIDQGIQ
jgi:hypothetical protein